MIPYDDLVIALATWRARQGLPIAQLSGSLTPPQVTPPRPPTSKPAPPAPPARGFVANVATPPPLAEAHEDVDEAALIEEAHYDNEGDDFAMAFGAAGAPVVEGESTTVGVPPPTGGRDSFGGGSTVPEDPPGRGNNNNDDW